MDSSDAIHDVADDLKQQHQQQQQQQETQDLIHLQQQPFEIQQYHPKQQ